MTGKLPNLHGKELIKILIKEFGCKAGKRTRGSHVRVHRILCNEIKASVIPMKKVDRFLLAKILKQLGISREEFLYKL